MSYNENDKDSFWSLEKLTPKNKQPLKRFSTEPVLSDFSLDTVENDSDSADEKNNRKLSFSGFYAGAEASPDKVYTPEGGLLKKITVKRICDKYDFYANFAKAAKLYFDFYTHECEFAKFYSYMPQYTQFSPAQKNYYFYWRYCIRQGRYIKTDYSYFYLYIYEILNLPELIPPEKGISLLIDAWCAYHKELPNINSTMALWVQDYCIVHGIRCPMERIKDFVFHHLGASGLKEFYLSGAESFGADGVSALILYLSDYDWRSTRYAQGELKDVYSLHFIGAMTDFFAVLFREGRILSDTQENVTLERTAFRGALVTAESKYRIEIEYKPLSDNADIRKVVTVAVKYTENKLRALIGVKSRLAVKDLAENYRAVLDKYFETLFIEVRRKRALEARPEYEHLYDAESRKLSIADADSIENSSWGVTARLVEAFGEDESEVKEEIQGIIEEKAEQRVVASNLSRIHCELISALLEDGYSNLKLGADIDSLVDEINSSFADDFGDIIIEKIDDEYVIIEDYREDVEKWLKKITK